MIFQTVKLEDIDFSDETFRMTEVLASDGMEASLKEVGLVNPVVLRASEGTVATIVCGFRRLHALRRLRESEVLARIEPSSWPPLHAFTTALCDNLSHRRITALECSRTLFILQDICGVDLETLIHRYLPMLGLKPHQNVLRTYLDLGLLAPALRDLVRREEITVPTAARLSVMPASVQERFAVMFHGVRLSASYQRKVLDLLEELGATAAGGLPEVMDRPDVAAACKDPALSGFQRGERVHDLLYRMQSPRLSRAHERFRANEQSLGLSGRVCFVPDPFFETSSVRVSFEASSPNELRNVASALSRAVQDPSADRLFQVE